MRPDDNVQELVTISVKAVKLTASVLEKLMKHFVEVGQEASEYSRTTKMSYERLATKGTTALAATDIEKRDLDYFIKEFAKYKVYFAVEKDGIDEAGKPTYLVHFLSSQKDQVEIAMKKVLQKVNERNILEKEGLASIKSKQPQDLNKEKQRVREQEHNL